VSGSAVLDSLDRPPALDFVEQGGHGEQHKSSKHGTQTQIRNVSTQVRSLHQTHVELPCQGET